MRVPSVGLPISSMRANGIGRQGLGDGEGEKRRSGTSAGWWRRTGTHAHSSTAGYLVWGRSRRIGAVAEYCRSVGRSILTEAHPVLVGGFKDVTDQTCRRRGWMEAQPRPGTRPSGGRADLHLASSGCVWPELRADNMTRQRPVTGSQYLVSADRSEHTSSLIETSTQGHAGCLLHSRSVDQVRRFVGIHTNR
ncbi:hypothetical protein LX32DRAFT_252703 [Colletotrichum zoysiae]|uniref:Uncharacterized protein n=1 Tax=Colletotrichum zoysiae TaxID=1216348 RepID=A0AAD9HW18_9PEZI|nr:hypothetical protein LX32DRAFT_252703 [Colletotrichum zoysiae]